MTEAPVELERLQRRLKQADASLREIADATGLGWHWLRAFVAGRIASPGFEKIERLRAYLDDIEEAA